ncbi:MAG: WG repeat-containing protein, partial [Muribaculaceae bacterium]|nr:WG repeat-containing protein [Muribaculaceae bacterium]
GKWGYINKSGKEVIPCNYQDIQDFDDHLLAVATKDNKKCLINKTQGQKGACKYDFIDKFKNGFYKVRRDSKWGFINAQGEEVVPCQYKEASDFEDNYSLVKDEEGKYGFLEKEGTTVKVAIPCVSESADGMKIINGVIFNGKNDIMTKVTQGGWCGIMGSNGTIIPVEYNDAAPLSPAIIKVKTTEGYGAKTIQGNEILSCKWEDIEPLGGSLLKVKEKGMYGIYETTGKNKKIVSPQFEEILPFSNGLAPAREKGKWGYINEKGKQVIDFIYTSAEPFNEDGIAVVGLGNNLKLIDVNRNFLGVNEYNEIGDFKDGIAKVKRNGKYGYINTQGEEIIPCKYDRIEAFNEETQMATTFIGDKKGYVKKNGNVVVQAKYDQIGAFNQDGIAKVKNNGLWGYVNNKGKELVPCEYTSIDDIHENMVLVSKNGKWGYAGINGYDNIPCTYEAAKPFNDGKAAVKKNGKWGYINSSNYTVIPFQYSDAGTFSNGFANVNGNSYINDEGKQVVVYQAAVEINDEFKESVDNYINMGHFREGRAMVYRNVKGQTGWGFINTQGIQVIKCQYDDVRPFGNKFAAVKNDGKWGFVDPSGNVVIPITMEVADVAKFSENRAFIAENMNQPMSYYFIDNKGNRVFGGNDLDRNKVIFDTDDENYELNFDLVPTFNNGECYVPIYGKNGYVVYDPDGNVLRTASSLPPREETKDNGYRIFEIDNKKGVRDPNGNVVVPAKYDDIAEDKNIKDMPIISSGVVYVILDNPNEERPDFKGFADFYGNDTFSESVLYRVEQAEAEARNNPRRQRVEEVVEEVEEDVEEVYDDEPEVPAKAVPARKSNSGFVPPTLNYSNEETGVGTLTVYRFNVEGRINNIDYETGEVLFDRNAYRGHILCDSNVPSHKISSSTTDINNQKVQAYEYSGIW